MPPVVYGSRHLYLKPADVSERLARAAPQAFTWLHLTGAGEVEDRAVILGTVCHRQPKILLDDDMDPPEQTRRPWHSGCRY